MIEAGILREDERFELVEGEIVIKAAKGIAHERMKSALNIALVRALPDHLTLGVEITLRLTDTVMLEPDIAVFPKELLTRSSTGFARLDPGEAHLVMEVAATNSLTTADSKRGFMRATVCGNSGSSTPTSASPSCIPTRVATFGRRLSNTGRRMRSRHRRCPASRSDSARSADEIQDFEPHHRRRCRPQAITPMCLSPSRLSSGRQTFRALLARVRKAPRKSLVDWIARVLAGPEGERSASGERADGARPEPVRRAIRRKRRDDRSGAAKDDPQRQGP